MTYGSFPVEYETNSAWCHKDWSYTLAEDCRQGLVGETEVRKHIRQRGNLFLHDGLLQLNAGSRDGHRVSHEAIGLIEELGYETSDQVITSVESKKAPIFRG